MHWNGATYVNTFIPVIPEGTQNLSIRTKRPQARSREIEWPPVAELIRRVEGASYEALGRELGVSGNAVRERIENHPVTP